MPDRLVVDLSDGQAAVLWSPEGGLPEEVSQAPLAWPLDSDALEELRWYLEDYLRAPFGAWEGRGPAVRDKLAGWGDEVFGSVFGAGPARDAYQQARNHGLEVIFRSANPSLLGLPWELMRDGAGPVALGAGGISRSLPVAGGAGTLRVPGGKLRVLMVISRPAGTKDVGFQMMARPLLERLEAVRGEVDLTVLRPSTFDALRRTVRKAADAGTPFHVVHFDGHGSMPHPRGAGPGEGRLAFEKSGVGSDPIEAARIASALVAGEVPVVVLNACQSGAVGKELEASVATALLKAGCAAVVAMAYSVYAVAAAEFMAEFYESLFAGDSVGQAVTAGRRRVFEHDGRPSPKGDLPLADWLVPVHYMRQEVRFPQARTSRSANALALDAALDQIRAAASETGAEDDPLAAVGRFVGRDDLFYQLETAARLQHVVVLAGPGGTGKTELAKGFARWWRDTGGVDDPRQVLWHSFEPGVASFGLDGVITSIGLAVFGADFARQDPPQRLEQVKELLRQRRVLLIWDNFESVREMPDPARATPPLDAAGCAALKDFLKWVRDRSHSVVIITSRAHEDWLGQVRRMPVGGLNRAEAAEYAGYLLEPYPAAQRRRERRAFGELLELLDGHPLAMRLTLPRLDTTDPADLLAGLRGTTPLTAEDAEPGRLSSLGACISYSFTHLSEQTRRLLPAVSLFQGIADDDVLAAFSSVSRVPARFAGVSKQEWTAVLEDATRVGLLTRLVPGLYQIHPALPGYLAAGWRSGDPDGYDEERDLSEQVLCAAYAAFSQWLIKKIGSGDGAFAYAIVELQRRTLSAMLGRALDWQAWAEAEDIVRALDSYWKIRGLGEEAGAWTDRILDKTEGPDQTPTGAAASLWLYTTVEQAGRQLTSGIPDQAEQTYRRALTYLQGQPETESVRENISTIYTLLAATAQERWRLSEAEDWCRKALAVKEELGDRDGMVGVYHQLGIMAQEHGRLDEAEDWYRKALTIGEELDDPRGMTAVYHHLGVTAQLRRRLDEAEDWHRKALALREELGDRPGMALTYHELGTVAQDRGLLDDAEDWYRKSLAIKEQLRDRPGTALTYHQLGTVAHDRRRLDEAEDWHRKSLAIYEELDDRRAMARAYHELGITAQFQGRRDEAEDWYRKSLTLKKALDNRPGMALTYAQLGNLAEVQAKPQQALEWYIRCVTVLDGFPNPQTATGPASLARLTRQLGTGTLKQTWQHITGKPVPQTVLDYINSQPGGERD